MGEWCYEVNAIADSIDKLEYGCRYYIIKNIPVDGIIPEPPGDGLRAYNQKMSVNYILPGLLVRWLH